MLLSKVENQHLFTNGKGKAGFWFAANTSRTCGIILRFLCWHWQIYVVSPEENCFWWSGICLLLLLGSYVASGLICILQSPENQDVLACLCSLHPLWYIGCSENNFPQPHPKRWLYVRESSKWTRIQLGILYEMKWFRSPWFLIREIRSFPIHTKWAQPVSDSDAVPQNHWAPGTAKLRHILYHKRDLTKQERFLTSYKLWSISSGTKYLSGVSEFFGKEISSCFMSRVIL